MREFNLKILIETKNKYRYLDVASSTMSKEIFKLFKGKFKNFNQIVKSSGKKARSGQEFARLNFKKEKLISLLGEEVVEKLNLTNFYVILKPTDPSKLVQDTGIDVTGLYNNNDHRTYIGISIEYDENLLEFNHLSDYFEDINQILYYYIRHEFEHAVQYSGRSVLPVSKKSRKVRIKLKETPKSDVKWLNYFNDKQEVESWAISVVSYFKRNNKRLDLEQAFYEVLWNFIDVFKKETSKQAFAKQCINILNYIVARYPEIAKKDESVEDLMKFLESQSK